MFLPGRPFVHRGFTLIELLIVVAIISILAAVAVPNYLEATQRALEAQCMANLKTLGTALAAYRLDHGSFPLADGAAGTEPSPGRTDPGNGPAAGGSWDGAPLLLVSYGYLTSDAALYCPACAKRHADDREHFRYAYNSSAADTGGHQGGQADLDRTNGDIWLARCVWVPPEMGFRPSASYFYPHGDFIDERGEVFPHSAENVLFRDLRVQSRNGRADFYTGFRYGK